MSGNAQETRVAAIVACFVAAGYPAESCREHRAERVLAGWLKAGVTPAVLDACIAELRAEEADRPQVPGMATGRPVEALEARVPAAMARARERAASAPAADLLVDAPAVIDDDAARHEAMKAKNAAHHAGMAKLAAPPATGAGS